MLTDQRQVDPQRRHRRRCNRDGVADLIYAAGVASGQSDSVDTRGEAVGDSLSSSCEPVAEIPEEADRLTAGDRGGEGDHFSSDGRRWNPAKVGATDGNAGWQDGQGDRQDDQGGYRGVAGEFQGSGVDSGVECGGIQGHADHLAGSWVET